MKMLIADDHPLVRDALARLLRVLEPRAEVIEAADYASIERQIEQLTAALTMALVDLNMPGMDGLAGVRRLRERYPALLLVVASAEDDPATIRNVLALGAAGYLPKSEPPDVMLQALRLVLSGGVYTPARALSDFRDGHPPPARPDASGLTPRQIDVLRELMRGQPNKLIARELRLTEGTVKIHIAAILRALHARNRTEAVVVARQLGIET